MKCERPSVAHVLTWNSVKGSDKVRENEYVLCVYHATKLVVRYKDEDALIMLARFITRTQEGDWPVA